MNKPNQLLLAQFFDELLERQLLLRRKKRLLNNVAGIFQLISGSHLEPITPSVLMKFTDCHGFKMSHEQCRVVIYHFDRLNQGSISYESFCRELGQNSYSDTTNNQSFLQLLQTYLDRERILTVCRDQLIFIEPYNIYDQVAKRQVGFITALEMYEFMDCQGITLCQQQLNILMDTLKADRYAYLTMEVLTQWLRPKECQRWQSVYQGFETWQSVDKLKNDQQMESLREGMKLDQSNKKRQESRERVMYLAAAEEHFENERNMRERVEQSVDQQFRRLRMEQLQFQKDIRTSEWLTPNHQQQHLFEASSARRSFSKQPKIDINPSSSNPHFFQPNTIVNSRPSYDKQTGKTVFKRRDLSRLSDKFSQPASASTHRHSRHSSNMSAMSNKRQ